MQPTRFGDFGVNIGRQFTVVSSSKTVSVENIADSDKSSDTPHKQNISPVEIVS